MWLNRSVTTLNTMLQFLNIYRQIINRQIDCIKVMALLMQKNCSFLGCVLSYTEKKEPRRRRKDSHNKDLIPYCSDAIILAIYVIKVKHPGFLFWDFSLIWSMLSRKKVFGKDIFDIFLAFLLSKHFKHFFFLAFFFITKACYILRI